jgi:hypothetical protein
MKNRFNKLIDSIKISAFVIVIAVFFVIGLAFFARPSGIIESEKRMLTEFPKLSLKSFVSDEWTSQVSLWYSDTYPLRDPMIAADGAIKSLYGIRGEQVIISGEADDIPDETMTPVDPDGEIEFTPTDDGGGNKVGGMYLNGDTAYQLYTFNEQNSRGYIQLVNKFASQVEGRAQVYDMIVPLHYQIALSRETAQKYGASDCKSAIDYMYSGLASGVRSVDILPQLISHNNEYLYYRTDHHWTARGAYYAYVAFCETKGITPTPLEDYERLQFDGFLGSMYADAKQPSAMKSNPDFVEAFVPMGTNDIKVTERNGNVTEYQIVNVKTDIWYSAAGSKYNCFIAGDNPISEIHNPDISDDSSIVIVKESFGNAFVPFLVDSYQHVYVIDYRYWSGNLANFVTENEIDDVLFLNAINVTSTSTRLGELADILK